MEFGKTAKKGMLRCSQCGYLLHGLKKRTTCPECGYEIAISQADAARQARRPYWLRLVLTIAIRWPLTIYGLVGGGLYILRDILSDLGRIEYDIFPEGVLIMCEPIWGFTHWLARELLPDVIFRFGPLIWRPIALAAGLATCVALDLLWHWILKTMRTRGNGS